MGDESYLPYLMFFGGTALLIWMLIRRGWKTQLRSRRQAAKAGHLDVQPRPVSQEWSMSDGPPELNRWQVEMLERTRELQATVDTKLLILQRVLAQAQQAMGEMTSEEMSSEERSALEATLRESATLVQQGPPNFRSVSEILCDDQTRGDIYRLHDEGRTQDEIAQRLALDPYAVEMILHLRAEDE